MRDLAIHSRSSFFFNDTATTEIYTLSLHDALPIFRRRRGSRLARPTDRDPGPSTPSRSEEHTSELQSRLQLVCRLLLEKKKQPHLISSPHSTEQAPSPERQRTRPRTFSCASLPAPTWRFFF